MSESKLDIQVRTTRVGDVNATGFTAIAMKEGNTEVVQVNLNSAGIVHCRVHNNLPYTFFLFLALPVIYAQKFHPIFSEYIQ